LDKRLLRWNSRENFLDKASGRTYLQKMKSPRALRNDLARKETNSPYNVAILQAAQRKDTKLYPMLE
jgi:hypothetical protein